jgi:3-oxo-5alpha-steroid 4-dehydrogenase
MKGIIVNGRGERIVNEEQYGARLGDALFQRAAGKAWLVVDHAVQSAAKHELQHDDLWPFQRLPSRLAMLLAKSAATVGELEAKMRLPANTLVATVQELNRAAEAGEPDKMGKSQGLRSPLLTPPFYAMDISYNATLNPVGGITLGGLDVDEDTGAVRNLEGGTIAGLYAAGRSAVGICSANYVSGLSLADCVWSGWRAAQSIRRSRVNSRESLALGERDEVAS